MKSNNGWIRTPDRLDRPTRLFLRLGAAALCAVALVGQTGCKGATCNQSCQDEWVGYGIDQTFWSINSSVLTGRPSGSVKNLTAAGNWGGTATINGTMTVSNWVETDDLTIVLQGYEYIDGNVSLTLTGTLTVTGKFDTTGSSNSTLVISSSSLEISGTIDQANNPTVTETVPVTCDDGTEQTVGDHVTGTIDGRPFTYVAPGASSGGSGSGSGSGSCTGSGTGNCTQIDTCANGSAFSYCSNCDSNGNCTCSIMVGCQSFDCGSSCNGLTGDCTDSSKMSAAQSSCD